MTAERKALAAAALASGMDVTEAAKAAGVARTTLWKWDTQGDPEFARFREQAQAKIIEQGVRTSVTHLRRIAPKAVEALERGIDSDTRYHVFSKTITTVEGEGKEAVRTSETVPELIAIPDNALSVRSALGAMDRIPELARRQKLEISGTLEARLVELDDSGATDSD